MMQAALTALTQTGTLTALFGFWGGVETTDAPIAQYPSAKPLATSDR